MKKIERQKARELRASGISILNIAKQLEVAKSSVSGWCRDIKLTEEQIEARDKSANYRRQLNGAQKRSDTAREKRLKYQQTGRLKAKEQKPLHMAGCMLYWAEGAKSRWTCSIANTDPNLLKFFIRFLREEFDVPDEKLTVKINCYTNNGLSVEEIENHWISVLSLPRTCLRKTTTDNLSKYSEQKKRTNKHIYGTCTVSYYNTEVIQHIYGAIQEYGGFDNNFCLDAIN